MEVIVKPTRDLLEDYIGRNINNFLLPLKNFSVESINYYSLDEIKEIRKKYPNAHLFISMNKNILNHEIQDLQRVLKELEILNIRGIFYYDMAFLNLKKKMGLKIDLVWNQTYMVTNYKTCNYYYNRGVKYALLSKEITKDEMIEIKKNSQITPIVELISYPVVAYSKRKLVDHYYQNCSIKRKAFLDIREPKTKQEYHVMEDQNGVSFVMKKLMNGSRILRELLDCNMDYILLKEDFIEHDVFINCLENINFYLKNFHKMTGIEDKKWLCRQNELLGRNTNFFYRKTIYKVK
ncbi:MAG: hypothetical protein HFJ12_03500 [Bacilli bacterium]|nr:hypothetical protein [Bacilli bacterium]